MQAAPSSHPPIIVSSLDYDRIEQLLESDLAHGLPGVDALEQELRRASVVEPQDTSAFIAKAKTRQWDREPKVRTLA